MSLSLVKCFSLLVASGNSEKCNDLHDKVRNSLLMKEENTGLSKAFLFKYGLKSHREAHIQTGKEVAALAFPMIHGIPEIFFGPDRNGKRSAKETS